MCGWKIMDAYESDRSKGNKWDYTVSDPLCT